MCWRGRSSTQQSSSPLSVLITPPTSPLVTEPALLASLTAAATCIAARAPYLSRAECVHPLCVLLRGMRVCSCVPLAVREPFQSYGQDRRAMSSCPRFPAATILATDMRGLFTIDRPVCHANIQVPVSEVADLVRASRVCRVSLAEHSPLASVHLCCKALPLAGLHRVFTETQNAIVFALGFVECKRRPPLSMLHL